MAISAEKLKSLLLEPGHVSEEQFESALEEAKRKKIDLEDVLVDKDLIKDNQLGRLVAESLGVKFIDLSMEKIKDDVLNFIPEIMARSKGVIAFSRSKDGIKVGMRDPMDIRVRHALEKRTGEEIIPYYITKRGLESALAQYKAGLRDDFKKILNKLKNQELEREKRDELVVQMVDMLFQYGYDSGASDIHIEPYREKVVVRFRVDGVMHDVLEIPKGLMDIILSRIKIMAKMRTDEHRAAQDGKIRFIAKGDEEVDVRVSVVPVTEGENVVMRLLAAKTRQFSLTNLGLSDKDLEKVRRAIKKPWGMILVTGPTGSGKTTTVYAVMKILNKREVHISTIEDPVEYNIEGISQIQVNPRTNLTFAKGLRAIVRQDPDIIMVGEIRDEETAAIAVNSAMTGHLVLSTLHANDAATTLPRLIEMKIEPFLIASTVNIVVAQRLVRKICEKCRVSYNLSEEEKKVISEDKNLKAVFESLGYANIDKVILYKGVGCEACGNTGYSGRVGIFEVLEMEENIKKLVIKRARSNEIMEAARKNGMTTMFEDGVNKMFQAVTTLQEVLRVTKM